MKKFVTAVFLLGLLISIGCSSTPAGVNKFSDVAENMASRLGQKVVLIGDSETRTGHSTERLFKLTEGTKFIWVQRNEDVEEPPQATKIRVEGIVQQKEFTILGKIICIEATKISME
jgi:hypothetical protein